MGNLTEPIKITTNDDVKCKIDDDKIPNKNDKTDNPLNIKYDKYQREQESNDYLRDQKINNLKKDRILEELYNHLNEKFDIKQLQNKFTLEIQNLQKNQNLNKNKNYFIDIISNKNKNIIDILQKKEKLINILKELNKLIEEMQINFKEEKLKDENRFKMLDKERKEQIENMNADRDKFLNEIKNLKNEKNVILNENNKIKNENKKIKRQNSKIIDENNVIKIQNNEIKNENYQIKKEYEIIKKENNEIKILNNDLILNGNENKQKQIMDLEKDKKKIRK